MLTDGQWIKLSEVKCHDGTPYPEEFEPTWDILKSVFDRIRIKYGRRIDVPCGYRTPKYNKRLIRKDMERGAHQVASGSKHVTGEALDISCVNPKDNPILFRIIMAMYDNGEIPELGGIAIYPFSGWIHIDIAKSTDGHLRKWKGV